jgi:hypothetical protein
MTFTVDIHHHLLPDFYRRATEHELPRLAAYTPAAMARTVGTDIGRSK